MTRSTMETGRRKVAVAALALLVAVAALGVIATASIDGGRSTFSRIAGAGSLEQSPLGR